MKPLLLLLGWIFGLFLYQAAKQKFGLGVAEYRDAAAIAFGGAFFFGMLYLNGYIKFQ